MKRLLIPIFTLALFTFFFTSEIQAQNSGNEGRAIAAAKSECGNVYHGQGVSWRAQVTALGICIVSGTFEIWEVWVDFSCPPQSTVLCLPAPPVKVATVIFDCDKNVVVQCE